MEEIRFCILCQSVVDVNHDQDEWHVRRKDKYEIDFEALKQYVFSFSEEGFLSLQNATDKKYRVYETRTAFSFANQDELKTLYNKCKIICQDEASMRAALAKSIRELEIDQEQKLIQQSYNLLLANRKMSLYGN